MLTTMWTVCTQVQSSISSKTKDKTAVFLFQTLKTKKMKSKLKSSPTRSKRIGEPKKVNLEQQSMSHSLRKQRHIFSAAIELNKEGQLSARTELACNQNTQRFLWTKIRQKRNIDILSISKMIRV
jgi:hypothetical protein